MATHRKPVQILRPDANVFPDLVANQITEAASPSIGDLMCYVMADGGVDEGVYGRFSVPKNYVGTPVLVIKGVLDGAPSAGDDLGFSFRERIVANNGAADGTFATEQTFASTDIGSSGSAHSDEDLFEATITLTGTYVVDSEVFFYLAIDASGTTYTGNFLLLTIEFQYSDV